MKITILTPTYNRAYILSQLYESLKEQSNQEFLWYIVDDGSTDHTKELVAEFIKEEKVQVRYAYKENGGKHTALNYGIKRIETELTFIVDSDDYLTEDAIETVLTYWEEVREKKLCGMNFLRGYSREEVIGKAWPQEKQIANSIALTWNGGITGDKAEVFCTDILKEFPFPEIEGERFFSEIYIWSSIAKKYDMLMINKIIYITAYLEDGLSKSGRSMQLQSPQGAMLNAKQYMSKEFKVSLKMKNAMLYTCYGFFAKKKLGQIYKENPRKLWTSLGLIPGFFLYLYWKRKFRECMS